MPALNTLIGKAKPRTFAIGDIHGCRIELEALIKAIKPKAVDTLIFLADYVDRGADSKGVLDVIMGLRDKCNVIALLGNHEAMMRDSLTESDHTKRMKMAMMWMRNGGVQTIDSYTKDLPNSGDEYVLLADTLEEMRLPESLKEHLDFIATLPLYHITDTHIFVHASPYLDEAIEDQDEMALIWRRAPASDETLDYSHISGKTIVSGHTAQRNGLPLKLSDKNIIIDSACVWSGWLTAMNIDTGDCIQASATSTRNVNSEDYNRNKR